MSRYQAEPQPGSAGPRNGNNFNKGRNRNTQRNNASKSGGGGASGNLAQPFMLGPQDNLALGQQRDSLLYDNQIARASLKTQASQSKADYQYARSGIREEYKANLGAVSGDMVDRGIAGSTVHTAGVADTFAAKQASMSEAKRTNTMNLQNVFQGRLEAQAGLRRGLAALAQQRAAMQRQMALAAYGSGGQNPWGY